ncbi:HNH endonuclease signature motif containing protein [Brevibacterium sp. K11IcPPYGO002]|uniref:HNH endonuclease signature motif containing protein n=1 Tax=Brevibacterium sp. K11IcPPYGO002 TaxID=3058837 RepID=UPI003D8193A9
MQPCVECGELSEKNRCSRHKLKHSPKTTRSHAADFNRSKWRRLSQKLRKASPFCEVCGTSDDLTVDHIVRVVDRPEWTYEPDNCRILCRYHNGKIARTPATAEVENEIGKKIAASKARRLRLRAGLHQPEVEDRPPGKALVPSHIVDKEVSSGDQGWTEGPDQC